MIKYILLIAVLFLTTACAATGIKSVPVERAKLGLEQSQPLELLPVEWKTESVNGKAVYSLDHQNYSNLEQNLEVIQNRLLLDTTIINQYQEYYEKTD